MTSYYCIVCETLYTMLLGLAISDFCLLRKEKKSDRALGLKSLPVMFGVTTAACICVLAIDVFQIGIAGYLVAIHENLYATIVFLLVIPLSYST